MPEVSIIMVTYNSAEVIGASLASAWSLPEVAQCYVVDNASRDATCENIREQFPTVELIENTVNKGFGAANNQALEKVTTPFALLLNPDAVLRPGAVAALLEAAKRYPDAAIIAPLIRTPDGECERSFKRNVFSREASRTMWQLPEGDVSAEYVSGAVCLLRMAHFENIGFFDANIFFYYEDDDLCLRARKAGKDIVLVPEALVVHHKGHSSAPSAELDAWKQRQLIISRIYLEKKYHGERAARKLVAHIRKQSGLKMALYRLLCSKRKHQKHLSRFKAASEGLRYAKSVDHAV